MRRILYGGVVVRSHCMPNWDMRSVLCACPMANAGKVRVCERGKSLDQVKSIRRKEAENAAHALNVHDITFWTLGIIR